MVTKEILQCIDEDASKIRGYVQALSVHPFNVVMYSEQQLKIMTSLRKTDRLLLHIDATGSVCCKVQYLNVSSEKKRILYYAAVIADTKCYPPIPVTEMVSNSHDIPSITNWLMRTVHAIYTIHGRKTKNGMMIVVDFCFAEIQASLQAFNVISLGQYLRRCYAIVTCRETTSSIKKLTTIYICAAHFVKASRTSMSADVKDKAVLEFFMFALARLQTCSSMAQACHLYGSMCLVFTSDFITASVTKHIDKVKKVIEDLEMPGSEAEEEREHPDNGVLFGDTLRMESPYTKVFDALLDDATESNMKTTKDSPINPYCIVKAFQSFHRQNMHLFPLFSAIMIDPERHGSYTITPKERLSINRTTNGVVEGWFRIVKLDTLQGKKRLPVGLFVRKMFHVLQGRIRGYHMTKTTKKKPGDRNLELAQED
jgi:hypothetical protein